MDLPALAGWTPAPSDDKVKEPTWELPLLPTPTHVSVLNKLRNGVRFDRLENPDLPQNSEGLAAERNLVLYTELHSAQQRALFTNPPSEKRVPVWKGSSFDQYEPHGIEVAGNGDLEQILEFLQTKRSKSRIFGNAFPTEFLNDPDTLPCRSERVVFRHVARASDSRTIIAALCPRLTPTY